MDEKIKNFCKNYECRIIDDNKKHARYHPPTYFSIPTDANIISRDAFEYQTEKLLTVEIPESRLKTLVEMEEKFFNYRHGGSGRDMFVMLVEKEREESFYRNSNEAVKKAYEQYSIMLNLAGYQRKI